MKNIERITQKNLEQVLIDSNVVDRFELQKVMMDVQSKKLPLEKTLLEKKVLNENKLVSILCNQLQLPYLSVKNYKLSTDLIKTMPPHLMHQFQFVPLDKIGTIMTILTSTIPNTALFKELRKVTNLEVYIYIGTISDVESVLKQHVTVPADYVPPAITEEAAAEDGSGSWTMIFDEADESIKKENIEKKTGLTSMFSMSSGEMESLKQKASQEGSGGWSVMGSTELEAGKPKTTKAAQAPGGWSMMMDSSIGHKPPAEEVESEEVAGGLSILDEAEEILRSDNNTTKTVAKSPSSLYNEKTPPPKHQEEESDELSPREQMEQLAAWLQKNHDYDALNQYVELAISINDLPAAIKQLEQFAKGLDRMGDRDGAVNCYEYILELDSNNKTAKAYLQNN